MNTLHKDRTSTKRRDFLTNGGLGLGSLLLATKANAANDKPGTTTQQTASEHARAESLPPESAKLPRWKPTRTGNFDLSMPLDNHYAFAKVQANLAGANTWLSEFGWILIAPPNKPAYPFLGRVQLGQIFVTAADPAWAPEAGEHDYTMWATFTTVHVDPRSFQPVSKILNPYTGAMIEPPIIKYADRLSYRLGKSIVVPGVDPKFYTQPWDRDGGFSPHHIDAGQTVTYTVLGSSQLEGPQQPRCDIGFWTVAKSELMNPALRSIDTHRSYSVTQKVSEYPWYGVPKGDAAQLLVHTTGLKTGSLARLPSLVRRAVLDRFRGRYA